MRDVWCQVSDNRCLLSVSDNRCLLSDIWCLMPDFCYQTSDAWFQMSGVRRLISKVWCQISVIRCLTSDFRCLLYKTFDVRHLMSDIWRQTTNRRLARNQTTSIRHLKSDVWHQTTNIRHLISDLWYETSDIREETCCQLMSEIWCMMMILRLWVINNTFLYFTPPFLGENSNFNISKSSFYMEREMSGNDTINSQLLSCWHLAVRDTQIKQKVAKSSAKKNHRRLTETKSFYYGLSLKRLY